MDLSKLEQVNIYSVINMHEKSLQGIVIEDLSVCPECGSKDLSRDDDETYCNKCGFVID